MLQQLSLVIFRQDAEENSLFLYACKASTACTPVVCLDSKTPGCGPTTHFHSEVITYVAPKLPTSHSRQSVCCESQKWS